MAPCSVILPFEGSRTPRSSKYEEYWVGFGNQSEMKKIVDGSEKARSGNKVCLTKISSVNCYEEGYLGMGLTMASREIRGGRDEVHHPLKLVLNTTWGPLEALGHIIRPVIHDECEKDWFDAYSHLFVAFCVFMI